MENIRSIAKNKKATFDYIIIQKLTAGIQLTGTEVKSIRAGKAGLAESYCIFKKDELWVKNMNIPEYSKGNINNHLPKRDRKLLMTKRELNKLHQKIKERGLTIIPLELYFTERGLIKLDIGLAKGKTKGDKRHSIKEKDIKREMEKQLRRKF
jgi:SsrA-binding protein